MSNEQIKAVRDCALAIIREREADGLEPLTATAREVSARMRANYLDVVFAFGALNAYGVATCGNTINDYFFKRNK